MPTLDHDHCYSIVQNADRRFDGWFVTAVRTTGIYCRPSCPAITPKRTNVEFHHTAAAAQQRGFRACKRCRPDASPGSPEWNFRQDLIGRAMRLIADGAVERDGVPGLAKQLGYSERHLNRVMTNELGAGPLAIARAHRAHTARLLIETTAMTFIDIAFAAGFGSVRQFNDTVREVFGCSPTELRVKRSSASQALTAGEVTLRLPTRQPFAGDELLAFLGAHAIPGVESWDGSTFAQVLTLPHGQGVVGLRAGDDHVEARVRLAEWADLATAVQRIRRLLDLDADPQAVDAALAADPRFAPLVARVPGRRASASADPVQTALRAVVGQQVSLAGARTVTGRLAVALGDPLDPALGVGYGLTHAFPTVERLAEAPDELFAMPAARRDTVRRLAAAVAGGSVVLDAGSDPHTARDQLLALKGIGPWTADYVMMRGLGHPDVFLCTDLVAVNALTALGLTIDDTSEWAPWRSYALHHLWASLGTLDAAAAAATRPRKDNL
ncbi:DNA-3-methyladenine glycosylase 2 family protein [Ilumatobacter sp.]|uniref:DNA-3-methyladenine glycosylase 2 family protein n=1 Tax=Ilumatobacter sp. TaxID=1967498 RepID=UPI0030A0F1D3